jgi:hypothetical protein
MILTQIEIKKIEIFVGKAKIFLIHRLSFCVCLWSCMTLAATLVSFSFDCYSNNNKTTVIRK